MLLSISFALYLAAFACYLFASLAYGTGLIGVRIAPGGRLVGATNWGWRAATAGVVLHGGAILSRFFGSWVWPTSNMFEFITFMGFTVMLAFQLINRLYPAKHLGAFVAPVATILIGYAAVFPVDVKPLIPALQSQWLKLHVSMAAMGEGLFAVAFGAAILYLLRTRDEKTARWDELAMESLFYITLSLVAFTVLAFGFRQTGHVWTFNIVSQLGAENASAGTVSRSVLYHLPPIIGPHGVAAFSQGSFLGIPMPLVQAPAWMSGKNFNTLLYALLGGAVLYWLIRGLITRRPLRVALSALTRGVDAEIVDEISYRAVAIGYPIFTLGGLIFAMIWAKRAWSRYWAWDPKETWAFISWCVYTIYLHTRIALGWQGRKSAWVAVVGFGVILFTLIGVNLLIVGLHSYAGGD